MTTAGSIGIGLSIDGGDLASEITRAVTSQLRPVLDNLTDQIGDISNALGDIDTEGIRRASRDAEQLSDDLDDVTDSTDRATRSTQEMRDALNRIDASSFNDIVRGAENAQQELAQLDRTQLDALIREAERAGQQIEQGVGQGASHAERQLAQLDQAGLDRLIREARQARDALDEVDEQADETGQASSRMGELMGGAAGKLAGLTAGLVGFGGAMSAAHGAIENDSLNRKLAAQLDLTAEEAERAGKLAGDLYSSNFGGSMEDVNTAISAVQSTIGALGEDSDEAFKSMTASALTMADVFEIDVAESTQTANTLIRNGFAKDGVEAMDLITTAMQRVPASLRGEIFPVMDEYATYFASIGFSGQEAMGLIVNAAQEGQIGMDKAGDAIKEFGIRATDIGDKGAVEALESMGFNAQQMANALLAGGDTAQEAFDKIVNGLLSIDDPAEQAAAATALFGTPLEDLDKAKIPGFLKGLANADDAMVGFAGSAEKMKDTVSGGPAAALETLKRNIEQGLINTLGTAAKFMMENKEVAIILAGAIGLLTGAYATYRTVAAVSGVIQGVTTALRGAEMAANASAGAMRAFTFAQTLQAGASKAQAAATAVATAAQRAFNFAFLSSPIGWIVVAIGAVVAALTLFFTKTEAGKAVWQKLMEWVKIAWEAIKTAIVGAWNNYIWPALQAIWSFITDTLIPIFQKLWQEVIVPAWNAIAEVIQSAWNNWIMPVFNALKTFIMDILAPALQWFWQSVVVPVFQAIAEVISAAWNNWIKPVWDAFVWVLQNVLAPVLNWLWNNVIVPVMQGIGAAISFAWNSLIKPVWDAFVWVLQNVLAPVLNWLWNNVVSPVMQGIGATISFAWNNVIKPVVDFMLGGWRSLGDVLQATWDNVIKPVWEFFGNLIQSVWENFISPAFDAIKDGVKRVGDFFSDVVDGIGSAWNGMKSLLAKPINFMIGTVYNNGIRKAWNTVAKFLPGIDEAGPLDLIPEHASGGRINGPAGVDNVLMWGSAGEHMLTVNEVLKAGGHNLVYAMRDMISRGIPFIWDNGRLVPTETSAKGYKATDRALQQFGNMVGNGMASRAPQGMFGQYFPKGFEPRGYAKGGEIEPWMKQLQRGHEFARRYSPLPYVAGNQLPIGADCSGWMSAIADVILGGTGLNGSGHWSTVAFPEGQASVVHAAGQVWHGGLKGNTLSIGMQGGPNSGGAAGHTRGTLGAVPALGIPAVDVESGGGTGGGPTYGGAAQGAAGMPTAYHIPIGPNGFFEGGGGRSGPSPEEQRGYLEKKVLNIFDTMLKPVHEAISGAVGNPPPEWKDVPHKYLKRAPEIAVDGAKKVIGGLGDALSSAWTKATDIGSDILHAANPANWFDSGGLANGKGLISKQVLAPERVLSPKQTELFEILVASLTQIARKDFSRTGGEPVTGSGGGIDASGRMSSDTARYLDRTFTSQNAAQQARHDQAMAQITGMANQLTEKVFVPMIQTGISGAMQAATQDGTMNALGQAVGQVAGSIVAASVQNATATAQLFDTGGEWKSGTLGVNLSGQTERVLDPAQTKAFDAGLLGGWNLQPQQQMFAGTSSRNTSNVGADFFGLGPGMGATIVNLLINTLLSVIGVQIQVRDTLTGMAKDVRQFRGEFSRFDATGRLTSDTSGLIDRTGTSAEIAKDQRLKILKDVLVGIVKFTVEKIIMPMVQALIQGGISALTTGIGAAIGTAIAPGVGTAAGGVIGNLVGQVVGAGLGGLGSLATGLLSTVLIGGAEALFGGLFGLFDQGGVANGVGLMPKATIAPERVLSPQQTQSFDRLVDALTTGKVSPGSTTTIHAPFTVVGGERGGREARDRLLSLMS